MISDDPTITRIRDTRHRISQEHSHDPEKVVSYYLELQKKYRRRLLKTPGLDLGASEAEKQSDT